MKRRTALLMAGTIAATWPLLAHAQTSIDWSKELGKHPDKTLRILMIQDPWLSGFEKLNPTFEKLTSAKVVIDAFGYDQTHEKEVLEGTSKSTQYDIIVLDSPWVGEFWSGEFVEDLKPYIDKTKPEVIEWERLRAGVPGGLGVGEHHRGRAIRRVLHDDALPQGPVREGRAAAAEVDRRLQGGRQALHRQSRLSRHVRHSTQQRAPARRPASRSSSGSSTSAASRSPASIPAAPTSIRT